MGGRPGSCHAPAALRSCQAMPYVALQQLFDEGRPGFSNYKRASYVEDVRTTRSRWPSNTCRSRTRHCRSCCSTGCTRRTLRPVNTTPRSVAGAHRGTPCSSSALPPPRRCRRPARPRARTGLDTVVLGRALPRNPGLRQIADTPNQHKRTPPKNRSPDVSRCTQAQGAADARPAARSVATCAPERYHRCRADGPVRVYPRSGTDQGSPGQRLIWMNAISGSCQFPHRCGTLGYVVMADQDYPCAPVLKLPGRPEWTNVIYFRGVIWDT